MSPPVLAMSASGARAEEGLEISSTSSSSVVTMRLQRSVLQALHCVDCTNKQSLSSSMAKQRLPCKPASNATALASEVNNTSQRTASGQRRRTLTALKMFCLSSSLGLKPFLEDVSDMIWTSDAEATAHLSKSRLTSGEPCKMWTKCFTSELRCACTKDCMRKTASSVQTNTTQSCHLSRYVLWYISLKTAVSKLSSQCCTAPPMSTTCDEPAFFL
mmetsp:Transcript_52824/g.138569  ORF Transcript_52824/g.138569 Transcript_52824/m.138569 type:complete len:216 (-) Transcript_52824:104-751(-)